MYKTETTNWHQSMAERNAEKLARENAALREALRLKEAECEALAKDARQWISVDDAPVNNHLDWEIGEKAIALGGMDDDLYVFEIEWDGDNWCSIGGDEFNYWMEYIELGGGDEG